MTSLKQSRTLFGFTSPRTIEKIIPEIKILHDNFHGLIWSGNETLQSQFFRILFESDFYEGDTYPEDPALADRDRITRAPKALGFIDLKPTIQLTEAGELLLSGTRVDETFTKQMLKFQLPSPYHTQSKTTDFYVKPYLELIRLINDLKSLSKTEISIFFLQLTDFRSYDDLLSKIIDFRKGAKEYRGNRKEYVNNIFEQEIKKIYHNEIENNATMTRESSDKSLINFIRTKKANMKDYADAFIRYIRATELITFERRTFRLIISPQKKEEVSFILSTIPREPILFATQHDFKRYLFNPRSVPLLSDNKDLVLEKLASFGAKVDSTLDIEVLKDILDSTKSKIKQKNIDESIKELKDYRELPDILNVFDQIRNREMPDPPLFLEWNVWRVFIMLNYAIRIEGNFTLDIDGMPLNRAQGNKADMEIEFDDFSIIGEVTLSSGATQFKMEGDSVPRHFGDFKQRIGKDAYCLFIAPEIDEGTIAFFFNLNRGYTNRYGGSTRLIPISLRNFIKFFQTGVDNKFEDPKKLKRWLQRKWEICQSIHDETQWFEAINEDVTAWAS
jgi:hypothetical protein